ncbi:hypothetical protein V3481_017606 [Fusarium oxysporum f. sp. vasinfectum]
MSLLFSDETAQYTAYKEATQRPHEVEWTNQIIGDAAAYAAPRVMSGTARIWGSTTRAFIKRNHSC